MQARVERVHLSEDKRIVAISDIHGDLNGLQQLLKKVDLTPEDTLFIIGDIVEKGPHSLDTLHYVMDLSKNKNVHVICGNCDAIAKAVYNANDNIELLSYLTWRKNSLLNEMCELLSINLTKDSDIILVKEQLKNHFFEELEWILNLPDIIETQKFIFVHAGLTSLPLEEQIATKVRRLDAFMEQGLSFHKYCVVGHWPVVLYCKNIPCCNPIVDREHKIISIDGGNVLKRDGQLNAFIIPDMNTEDFTFIALSELERCVVLDSQVAKENSMVIPWIDNQIKVLKKEEEFSYCEHKSSKYKMWILNKYIYMEKDEYHCEDSTDYQLPVEAGETVEIVEITNKGYYVKKDGISGWYFGRMKIEEQN